MPASKPASHDPAHVASITGLGSRIQETCSHSPCTGRSMIPAEPISTPIRGKKIPLKTNALLSNSFEPLPTMSYRRTPPFVVTRRKLRKLSYFQKGHSILISYKPRKINRKACENWRDVALPNNFRPLGFQNQEKNNISQVSNLKRPWRLDRNSCFTSVFT